MAQKNFKKLPAKIINRVRGFRQNHMVAACVVRVPKDLIGKYKRLGLTWTNDPQAPEPQLPDPKWGKHCRWNIEGREIKRTDLEKVEKTYSWETPNWGDWSNGSHVHYHTRLIYQRELIPPKELELTVEILEVSQDGNAATIKFAIDQVLNRRDEDFEPDLLYALNLLYESVGALDVFPSEATSADFLATIQLAWEVLPPGQLDEVLRRVIAGRRPGSPATRELIRERLTALQRLRPNAFVTGTSGFMRYFGARFEEDFVVFENLSYGNAIYVMYEDWQALSQKSRIDLLKGPRNGFDRIEHREGWEDRVAGLLRVHRGEG